MAQFAMIQLGMQLYPSIPNRLITADLVMLSSSAGFPIARTGGFLVGHTAVLVIESKLNERLNCQPFRLIAAETDKPIRYLVNTSHHGDHSYGNFYVPEEIKARDTEIFVSEVGSLTIDLRGITVSIQDFGFAYAGGILFVSVPNANVLWTGNSIILQGPALPWLLDGHLLETRDTLRVAFDSFDADKKVKSGRGPVNDIASLKCGVDYLTAMGEEVRAVF